MSGPIRQQLADVASVTPTLNDKAVTIQANTVRTSTYTAIYNLFKAGFDLIYLTAANLVGYATEIYADNAATTAEANANNYSDTTKQPLFDYSGNAIGVTPLTINGVKGGVAEFTNVIARNTSTTLRINSDAITVTSKIIYSLKYNGAGFPQILSHFNVANRVDFRIANTDPTLGLGAATDAPLFIEYQIIE